MAIHTSYTYIFITMMIKNKKQTLKSREREQNIVFLLFLPVQWNTSIVFKPQHHVHFISGRS